MGYCILYVSKPVDGAGWATFKLNMARLLTDVQHVEGIGLVFENPPDVYNLPIIHSEFVSFNGCGEHSCEDFFALKDARGPTYIKTNWRPYGLAVKAALKLLLLWDVDGLVQVKSEDDSLNEFNYGFGRAYDAVLRSGCVLSSPENVKWFMQEERTRIETTADLPPDDSLEDFYCPEQLYEMGNDYSFRKLRLEAYRRMLATAPMVPHPLLNKIIPVDPPNYPKP